MLLAELKSGPEGLCGKRLRGIYPHGSYAREEAEPDSDADGLTVLDRVDSCGAEVGRTTKLVSEVSLRLGVSVSRYL